MTEDKFNSILNKQLSNTIKCQQANYIINTDFPEFSSAKAQVAMIIDSIIDKNGDLWRSYTSSPAQVRTSTSATPAESNTEAVDISVVSTETASVPTDTTTTASATTTTTATNAITTIAASTTEITGTITTNTLTSVTTTTTTLRLKDHYDLVVFDLDDTLVPTYPPIIAVCTPYSHSLFIPLFFTTSFPT